MQYPHHQLTHYSKNAHIILDKNKTYSIPPHSGKPTGLWVSVDSEFGWAQWCYDNEQDQFYKRLKYKYDVVLYPHAKILVLDSAEKIVTFSHQYRDHNVEKQKPQSYFSTTKRDLFDTVIDWKTLKSQYDGIIISPYQDSVRLQYKWYYGFDCASGCIWNLSCINTLTMG